MAIVGEAWGDQEEIVKRPFIGSSGQELTTLLTQSGIQRRECFLTNVFAFRPPRNKLEDLCGKKAEVGPGYDWAPLKAGQYVLPRFLPEVERLRAELLEVRPNLVIAMGATACWALLGKAGIAAVRGSITSGPLLGSGQKILATYHPAAVLRQWNLRPIVRADLEKAAKELTFPEIIRPSVLITYNPTIEEVEDFASHEYSMLSIDIETSTRQMTMISFSHQRDRSFVIPFWDKGKPGWNYWDTPELEVRARRAVMSLLQQACPKVLQNGLYDAQYCWREGMPIRSMEEDTMLLHHSLHPELNKGLGFLGSIYTQHPSWKLMRKTATTKRDE